MQVNITGETERLIQAALATGKYTSAEDFIAAKLKEQQSVDQLQSWPSIPRHVDIDTLAAQQGVGPIKDFRDLKAVFATDMNSPTADEWPARWEDEDVMFEAWEQHRQGIVPLPLSQIQASMRGIVGKLSDDVSECRDDRL